MLLPEKCDFEMKSTFIPITEFQQKNTLVEIIAI